MYKAKDPSRQKLELKAKVALDVCLRRVQDIDAMLDEKNPEKELVTKTEWEILSTDEMSVDDL